MIVGMWLKSVSILLAFTAISTQVEAMGAPTVAIPLAVQIEEKLEEFKQLGSKAAKYAFHSDITVKSELIFGILSQIQHGLPGGVEELKQLKQQIDIQSADMMKLGQEINPQLEFVWSFRQTPKEQHIPKENQQTDIIQLTEQLKELEWAFVEATLERLRRELTEEEDADVAEIRRYGLELAATALEEHRQGLDLDYDDDNDEEEEDYDQYRLKLIWEEKMLASTQTQEIIQLTNFFRREFEKLAVDIKYATKGLKDLEDGHRQLTDSNKPKKFKKSLKKMSRHHKKHSKIGRHRHQHRSS